ncbi:MAG: hypothetical protein IPM36_00765 [Lewinellaceae bacterium]|nr:hypothetical protein [Lewinellaceae bacterium]
MTRYTLLPVSLLSGLLALANFAPPAAGPCDSPVVGGHTGAPGETSCTGCHGGTANTGTGTLTLALSDTTLRYIPGETFDATVILRQTGRDKFGFVGLALKDAGNTTVGTFTIDDAVRTRTFSDGPRKYVSHTPCGADAVPPDSLSWTFHWKAPATNVGNITLYLAGLAANHNHALSGDDTYTMAVHFVPDTILLSAKEPVWVNRLRLWPNPVTDAVHFATEDLRPVHKVEIWSGEGRLLFVSPLTQNQLSVKDLDAGVYWLRVYESTGTTLGQATFVKR